MPTRKYRVEVKRNWVVLYYPALHERRLSIGAVPINCRMSVLAVTVTVVSLYPAEEDLRRWLSVDVRRDEREEKGNPHPLVVVLLTGGCVTASGIRLGLGCR